MRLALFFLLIATPAIAGQADCSRLGSVHIGLAPEGVLKSCWGKPLKVNVTTYAEHRIEQWVYGPSHYLYLTDGLVTAIQSAR